MDAEQCLGESFFFLDSLDIPDSWPVVGSDEWLKRQLIRLLVSIHHAANQTIGESPFASDDPDKYVYLVIPHRHRRLGRLLGAIGEESPSLVSCLNPRNEASAFLVQKALKAFGINAEILVRLRDMDEEVVFR